MHQLVCALVICLVGLFSCGCSTARKKGEAEPTPDPRLDQVVALMTSLETQAADLSDKTTGWLANDCDGFGWEGERWAATLADSDVLLKAQLEPGKFDRRPTHGCAYTWSRDMLVRGLLPWAWLHKRRDVLEQHATYGEKHAWKMGDPLGDLRVLYVPAEIGALRKGIVALGGKDNVLESIWPDTYPSGLTDFEADLQVMTIWYRGEVADGDDAPRAGGDGISQTMFDRLQEHAGREPQNCKYQAVLAKYTGDFTAAIDDVLDPNGVGPTVRCGAEPLRCVISERMFCARLILRQFGKDTPGTFGFSFD